MKFSLIMATLGRTHEVDGFLASLDAQSYRDFELIVVDQNPDDRLVPLLKPRRERFPLIYLRSAPGLSLARNIGLRRATGEVVGFPDDDCRYSPHFLDWIARFLKEHPRADGISGRVADEDGSSDARFDPAPGPIDLANAWRRTSSVSLFVRKRVVETVGGFDETLGVGAETPWRGAEDIDYALRAVRAGFEIRYDPDLVVFHPNPLRYGYRKLAGRAHAYGAGIGRVWRKHDYPTRLVTYHLLRPLGGAVLSIVTGRRDKALFHWSAFRGRLYGWLSWR